MTESVSLSNTLMGGGPEGKEERGEELGKDTVMSKQHGVIFVNC